MTPRSITIIGGGAIGGITAAYLARDGCPVTVADPWREHTAAMRRGLQVDGVRGEFRIPLQAVSPEELEGSLDLVLLAVKSVHTEEAVRRILPLLHAGSTVVSLQNSINEDLIAALIGPERTVGCMIGWGATSVGPGRLTQTSPGEFVIGGLRGETGGPVREVHGVLSRVTECQVTANIYGHLWVKLIVNCVIATGALLGKTVGETVADPETHGAIKGIIGEALQVAHRCGIILETGALRLEPEQYLELRDFVSSTIIQLLAGEHALIFPSIYQDILKGRRSEIDHINGYIVARGAPAGVPTPLNRAVVAMIHEIEAGSRSTGMDNFRQLQALI